MGSHPYWYFIPYQDDLQRALDGLRAREFGAGRYNPVIPFLKFEEPAFSAQHPGPKHRSMRAALVASDADGTRSILDVERVGPAVDAGVAAPFDPDALAALFGTQTPSHAAVDAQFDALLDGIGRGECRYVLVHDARGVPTEILFAGYSYD